MAEAGVAPGAAINDDEGENLGANQEIPQQQAQGEVVVNIMNQVLIWIGFDVVANRRDGRRRKSLSGSSLSKLILLLLVSTDTWQTTKYV